MTKLKRKCMTTGTVLFPREAYLFVVYVDFFDAKFAKSDFFSVIAMKNFVYQ